MSYAQENGYTPQTVSEILDRLRERVNAVFFTSYDETTFVGTNWYRFLYAAAQYMQRNEVSTSEIFLKLQEYIATTNQRIQRPSVSYPGLLESFESKGYIVSVAPVTELNAGTISICANVDDQATDYPIVRLEICNLVKQFVAAGIVSLGTEVETIVLDNGQPFDFKFFLPTKKATHLKLTVEISDNNLQAVPSDEDIRFKLLEFLTTRYRLGWDFEPQKYYTMNDAPWAAEIKLEYSFDGGTTYHSTVYQADFKDLLTFELENIDIIITDT